MILASATQANIDQAAVLLRQGRLVAIPTETVYGLAANAKSPAAVKKIFAAKGRPAGHPLIVHLADASQLPDWALEIPDSAYKLAERFWPGPLTVVLKKHPDVPLEVTGGQNTVALRVPNHPVALAVLKTFGDGLAAPSANRFCRISPTQASHVEEELGRKVDMILDGGACEVGLESTIVDLSGRQPRLLRPGQVVKADIEAVLGQSLLVPDAGADIRAPGRMAVHYAPATKTLLLRKEEITVALNAGEFKNFRNKIGVLCFGANDVIELFGEIIFMPNNASEYAHLLYGKLRELDDAGLELILVEQPTQTEEWQGVNDRLAKAARRWGS